MFAAINDFWLAIAMRLLDRGIGNFLQALDFFGLLLWIPTADGTLRRKKDNSAGSHFSSLLHDQFRLFLGLGQPASQNYFHR